MDWVASKIKWIMLVSGALTFTMVYAAIAPEAALRSTFGDTLNGPVADVVVRSWGALIALVGAMLIYAAFTPPVRPMVATVAIVGKLIFVGLILSHGSAFLGHQAGVAVVVDLLMVALFVVYLAAVRRGHAA